VDAKIYKSLMTLLVDFPYNNLLHLRIDQILTTTLDPKNYQSHVLENIMDDSGLVQLILQAVNHEN
jgi:hypothetical protein